MDKAAEQMTDDIMTLAQEFASSWSLLGSRFAASDQLEIAEESKAELRRAVLAALSERAPVAAQPLTDDRIKEIFAKVWYVDGTAARKPPEPPPLVVQFARAILAAQPSAAPQGWISVTPRTLPPDDTDVIVSDGKAVGTGCYVQPFGWEIDCPFECGVDVTHWMPLPAAPKP